MGNSPLELSEKPLFFRAEVVGEASFPLSLPHHGVLVRTIARSLSVMQKEALVYSPHDREVWRLSSDEGPYLLADDVAPCPLAFVTAGMISAFADSLRNQASLQGITIRHLRLVQDNYYTMQGSALQGTMTAGALPVKLRFEIAADVDDARLQDLVNEAVTTAPVYAMVRRRLPGRFSLTHNGRLVEVKRGEPMPGSIPGDPAGVFDRAVPLNGPWENVVRRNGLTPESPEDTSSKGSSFSETQNRQLHLRGTLILPSEGVKEIEVQMFNPRGTVFRFLSKTGHPGENKTPAPDALTYFSAGIAFCFMTQLSRYAQITKKNLQALRVVQDAFFPAHSYTAVDPVETHVYVESDENDIFARKLLAMGEQTCFVHALLRTESDVEVTAVKIPEHMGGQDKKT